MGLRFGKARRIINFARTCVTSCFFELQTIHLYSDCQGLRIWEITYRVVEAWAMIFPPIGFFSFPAYGPADASGLDITWLVTTTAIPNYNRGHIRLRIYWQHEDTLPRPQAVVMYVRICPGGFGVKTIRHAHWNQYGKVPCTSLRSVSRT